MKDQNVTINIKSRFHRGGFVRNSEVVARVSDAYTTPRRHDVLRRTDGDFKVCRVRADRAGIREAVCTNGARTIFVPLSAVNLRLVGHYRNGVKLN